MLLLYTSSVFLSAFLVFLVQPMVGKMFLPWVGGAPAAWNTCMFFFQLLLLGGYFYTHLAFKALAAKKQMLLHLVLMGGAWLSLPIVYAGGVDVPSEPSLWLLRQLFVTVALPFLFLSSTAPMLQKWFSLSNHPRASNPFFLYAASNAGSLAALLVYPVLMEPYFNLAQQSTIWSWCFGALNVLLFICALMVRPRARGDEVVAADAPVAPSPDLDMRLRWLLAAAVPSSMFLATTHFLTRDIAPVPFLWIIPLAVYLLTYILAFSEWFKISTETIRKATILGLVIFFPVYFLDGQFEIWMSLPAHVYVLFSFALLCHRFLADTRPAAEHLTIFYLMLSVGGVVGGFFNAMIAPFIFVSVAEYPLAVLVGTVFLRQRDSGSGASAGPAVVSSVIAAIQMAALIWMIFEIPLQQWATNFAMYFAFDCSSSEATALFNILAIHEVTLKFMVCILLSLAGVLVWQRQFRLKLVVFVAVVMMFLFVGRIGKKQPVLYQSRNFFGSKEVIVRQKGTLRELVHGNTIHGAQSVLPALRKEPLAYYHRLGPAGDVFALPVAMKPDLRVAVLGLGPGNAAAYGKAGQHFTFIEIDPEIVFIAEQTGAFTFLSESPASCPVIIGDARLQMSQQQHNSFDMIIMAAFSSDSIPVHLLTVEALKMYLDKLSPEGVIVINISNRYLDLVPLVAALAAKCGLHSVFASDHEFDDAAPENYMRVPSLYALMSRDQASLPTNGHPYRHKWRPCPTRADVLPWTDSFSSLLPLLCLNIEEGTALKMSREQPAKEK